MHTDTDPRDAAIRAGLAPLIDTARKTGCWLMLRHGGGALYSPDELKSLQEKGELLYSRENWALQPPDDYLAALRQEAAHAAELARLFEMRLNRYRRRAAGLVAEQEC